MILTAYWCYSQCLHVVKPTQLTQLKAFTSVISGLGLRDVAKQDAYCPCRGENLLPFYLGCIPEQVKHHHLLQFFNWNLTVSVSRKNQRCFAIKTEELQSQMKCFCFKHLWIWEDQLNYRVHLLPICSLSCSSLTLPEMPFNVMFLTTMCTSQIPHRNSTSSPLPLAKIHNHRALKYF